MNESNQSPDQEITVALVEDQAGLRESLRDVIDGSENLRCVAACANAEQALKELPELNPQVVFMDINLPGMDGVACVRELVTQCPEVLVIMLTAYDNTEAIFGSLEAGACGYFHKPIRRKELADAARSVVDGGSPMSAKIARMVVQTFKKPAPPEQPPHADFDLTAREQEILDLLVQGFLYKEIADRLDVSGHTVHFHIRNIYKKLQVRSRAQAVAIYLGNQ